MTLRSCSWNAVRSQASFRHKLQQYAHVLASHTAAIMTTICRCSVRECTRTSRNSDCSFFRFPKDAERAKIWAMACKRDDLQDKLEKLHNSSYRVCGAHFRKEMFASDLKNRLQRLAVPTIFPHPKNANVPVLGGTTIYILQAPGIVQSGQQQSIPGIITYASKPVPPLQRAPNLTTGANSLRNEEETLKETTSDNSLDDSFSIVKEEFDIEPQDSEPPSPIPMQIKEEPQVAEEDIEDTTVSFIVKEEPPSPIPDETPEQQQEEEQEQQSSPYIQVHKSTCHRQIQTSADMILHSPRVQKLKRSLKTSENHNFVLKQKIAKLMRTGSKSVLETITFQDYKRLTYAFCPSKTVADSVIKEVTKAREAASVSVHSKG